MKIGNTDKKTNIEFLNLISTDVTLIENAMVFSPVILAIVLQTIAVSIVLVMEVKIEILSGLLLLGLVVPFQMLLAYLINKYK